MKVRLLPLTLGLLWIITLAAAFRAGAYFNEAKPGGDESSPPAAITFSPADGGADSPEEAEAAGEDGDTANGVSAGPAKARRLIEFASREMGSGGGAMFSPSKMFRACGPLMELTVDEVKAALAEVKSTVTDAQQRALLESVLLGRWAETDPIAALAHAETLVSGEGMMAGQALMSVIGAWAQKDPEAALAWYQKRRDSDAPAGGFGMDDGALMMIFNGLMSHNPERALDSLDMIQDERSRGVAIGGIAMAATDTGLRTRLLDRAETLDPETRDSLRQGILGQWAAIDPDGAIAWAGGLPPDEITALIDGAGHSFLFSNPEKGAEFLLTHATDETLSRRYSQIIDSWVLRDPIAAGEWLNRQPKDPAQDQARSSFAINVVRSDPEVAMEWAKSVSNEQQRTSSVMSVYRHWQKRNPEAAEAALNASGLPADQIERARAGAAK